MTDHSINDSTDQEQKIISRNRPSTIVETRGGSYIAGNVSVAGNFAGRDIVHGFTSADVAHLMEQLRTTFQPKPFDGRSPYVGLEPFQEADADRFFGRERLVADLITRVESSRHIVITGPSGSGKSSLVRGGLLPQLKNGALPHSEQWLYASLNPGRTPLHALGRVTASLTGHLNAADDVRTKGQTDTSILHQWLDIALGDDGRRRAVLFVDQFEEVFTQVSDPNEQASFLDLLTHAAIQEGGRAVVLFTMRSDFISNCALFPQLNALLNQQFIQIGAMQPDELVRAIALPALHAGLQIDPDLIAQIVNDMGSEPGALPLMQFALKDLFDERRQHGGVLALTLSDYLARGGIRRALQRHADEQLKKLDEGEIDLVRAIFSCLIQVGRGAQDTSRTATFDELVPAGTDRPRVADVIRKLADARLITTDEQHDKDTVTIAHERLIDAWPWLHQLVAENREAIALQNKISEDARQWNENKQDNSYLYTGARLATVQEQLDAQKLVLSDLAKEFVAESIVARKREEQQQEEQRQREILQATDLAKARQLQLEAEQKRVVDQEKATQRFRWLSVALAGLVLIALAAAAYAYGRQQAAVTARTAAEESEQEAQAARQRAMVGEQLAVEAQETAEAERLVAQAAENRAVQALREAQEQSSRQLAALAQNYLDDQLDRAGLLSLQAYAISTTVEARASLLKSTTHNPQLTTFLHGHDDSVSGLVVSTDGFIAASTGNDHLILWDLRNRQRIATLESPAGAQITAIAMHPNDRTIVTGDTMGYLIFWEIKGEEMGQTESLDTFLSPHEGAISSLAFSPDGMLLASSSYRETMTARAGEVRVWNWQQQELQLPLLHAYVSSPRQIAFSPDGTVLATAGCAEITSPLRCDRGELVIWNLEDGDVVSRLSTSPYGEVLRLLFLPRHALLVGGGVDGTLFTWDINDWETMPRVLTGATRVVYSLAASPSGEVLAVGGCRRLSEGLATQTCLDSEILTIHLEDEGLMTADRRFSLRGHGMGAGNRNIVTNLAFLPDSHQMLSTGSDGRIILWDISLEQQLARALFEQDQPITAAASSIDGRRVATSGCLDADEDGRCRQAILRIWTVPEGQLQTSLELPGHTVRSLAVYGADPDLVGMGTEDGSVLLWALDSNQIQFLGEQHHSDVTTALAFTPDGAVLASGGDEIDRTIQLWDVQSGQPLGDVLVGHRSRVSSLSFSMDGSTLASGGADSAVYLWDVATQQKKFGFIATPLKQTGEVTVVFDPTRQNVLFSSNTTETDPTEWTLDPRLWDPVPALWEDAGLWSEFSLDGVYLFSERSGAMRRIAIPPSADLLVGINAEGKIILWDIATRRRLGLVHTESYLSNQTAGFFGANGRLIMASQSPAMLWDLNVESWRQRICQRSNRTYSDAEVQEYGGDEFVSSLCPGIPAPDGNRQIPAGGG